MSRINLARRSIRSDSVQRMLKEVISFPTQTKLIHDYIVLHIFTDYEDFYVTDNRDLLDDLEFVNEQLYSYYNDDSLTEIAYLCHLYSEDFCYEIEKFDTFSSLDYLIHLLSLPDEGLVIYN